MGFPKKISQLPLNLNLKPEDLLVTVNESDVTSKIKLEQLISFVTGSTNTFVTGGTYNDVTQNIDFSGSNGFPPFSVSLTGISTSDTFVTGATLNGFTLEIDRNNGEPQITVDLSSLTGDTDTNTFVTGTTLVGTNYTINQNNGSSFTTDFNPIITGKVDTTTFDTYTADTQTEINNKLDTTVFNTYSGLTQTEINNKLDTSIFDTYTANTVDNNTFITGTTLVGTEYTINQNNGSAFTTNFNPIVSGFTTGSTLQEVLENGSIADLKTANIDLGSSVSNPAADGFSRLELQQNGFIQLSSENAAGDFGFIRINGQTGEAQLNQGGLKYGTDYSATFTDRSLVDKEYVDDNISNKLDITTFDTYTANTTDDVVTGATLVGGTLELERNNGLSDVTVDLSSLSGDTNTFVTGATLTNTTLDITRNDGVDISVDLSSIDNNVFVNSGNANAGTQQLTFTNTTGGTFNVTNAVALFSDNDINVTGGTYNPTNGCVTFSTNSGTTFDICGFVTGFTDVYVTGSTLVGTNYTLTRTDNTTITTDFDSIVSGKVDTTTFESYSALTQMIIDTKLDKSIFNTYTANTTDDVVTGATLVGATLELERNNGLTDVTVDLSPLSGISENTFISATTLVGTNYTLERNDGVDITTDFNPIISGKVDTILFDTYTANTTDNVVTGATLVGGTLELERNNGLSDVTVDLSSLSGDTNTFVTGATLTNTTLGIERNDGVTVSVNLSSLTGDSDTNTFVTGTTLTGNDLIIERNDNIDITTDLTPIISGKVDTTLFDTYTANTTDNVVTGATLNGFTLELERNNGLTDVTVDLSSLTGSVDTNTFVTGTTLTGNDLIIERNDGIGITTDLTPVLSGKVNTTLFDTYTANTTDNVVTGATLNGTILELERNNGLTDVTVDLSSLSGDTNTFVTGATLTNTTLDITRNDGVNIPVNLGSLTFTGNTSGTCINELWVSNISGCSSVTIGTELIVNDFMSGKTTTLFGENNVGGGSRTSLTPTLTIFDNPGTGGGSQNYAGPNLRFSDNGNIGDIFYRYNGGGNLLSNAFNFISDGGFNFIAEGDNGSPSLSDGPYFRITKGQSSLLIYDDTTRPRTDVKITNANGGTAYSRLGVGAQNDYWYIEADDVDTPMHIGYDDNGVDTNVLTFEKSDGLLEGSLEITSGLTADTITLSDTPTLNNSGTEVLVRNSTTGEIEYRASSTFSGSSNEDINTGNVLWVDSIFGDDGTALTNRQDKPYLTIESALNDTTNGDTVIVRPGEYPEEIGIPEGVSLVSEGGWEVTILGPSPASAGGAIVELSEDSFIDGFSINVPQGSFDALISTHISGTSTANNITFYGNGGVGSTGTGLYKTGGGKLIGYGIRVEGGGMSNCLKVDSGTLALEGVHVPESNGDIDNVLLVTTSSGTNAGRAQMVGFNCGNSNVTNAIRTEGGSSGVIPVAKIFTPNISNSTNALSASGDYEEINLLGGSLENVTYLVNVDLTGTGIDASYRITSNHQPNYIYPPAVAYTAEFGLDFTQESTDVFNSSKNLFGLDQMSLGFAERGTEMNVGRGAPSTVGMKIFTTDNTTSSVSDGGNFIDVTDDAESKEGSTITFQSGGTGTTILFTTRRVSSDLTTPLKFYGLDINILQKKVGGDYVFEYWNGTEWKRDLWHIHSEDLGYSYGNDLFLRSQSNENISFELSKDSANLEPNNDPWSAKTINGVTGYWMRCRMISTGTTKPTIEQVKIIYDSSTISKEGVLSFNGRSLHKEEINLFMGTWSDPAGDLASFSVTVGDGTGAETWTQQFLESQFATNGDFGTFLMKIPQGISTSQRVKVKITYILSGTGDEDTPSEMRLSFLPVEVGNVLIADSDGGKTPIPRSPQNVTPFNTYPAEIVEIDTDFGENIVLQSTVGTFDISNYYEGDIILFRLEHIQATTINLISFDLEVSKWSLGKQAQPLVVDTQILLEEDWSDLGVANGWVFRQPSSTAGSPQNIWTVSSDTSRTGSNSAYISDETWAGGVPPYQYRLSPSINSYMYVDFDVPSSCIALTVSFYWTCVGESSFDYGMVGLAPTTFTPSNTGSVTNFEDYEMGGGTGNRLNTSYVAGATEGNWQLETISVPSNLWTPGEQARFMLRWRNDGSVGTQPPIAIDDITITSQFIVS